MQQTPLHGEYAAHGAKVVDFHGWALPVQFSGIIPEHLHTRAKAGLFDCSHMGEFVLRGQDALQRLDSLVYSDMMSLRVGLCRYSAILNERGGVIDDCVGIKLDADTLYLVTNAGPRKTVAALLGAGGGGIEDVSDSTTKIDLQGPKSREILLEIGLDYVKALKYWNGGRASWRGADIVVTRAGYTGELGYELFVPNAIGVKLWRTLAAHPDVLPCGLGARDTLRSEVGYPLNGEDLAEDRTPLESGMERFIVWEKEFAGKAALETLRAGGNCPVLVAIRSFDRRAPRHGFELTHEGRPAGVVTSGTFGPSLGYGVGLARVSREFAAPGVRLSAGPRNLPVETAEIPLYKNGTCRMPV